MKGRELIKDKELKKNGEKGVENEHENTICSRA